ncbi:MAG TPA: polyphenol oxidase family protein [Chthoniobacterales bacterium]|nr:polyphenol oxidase family protein [Chthoniobacterales bacterium]
MTQLPFEQFSALNAVGICRHVFTQRTPGIDVSHDKVEALRCLDWAHREIRRATGVSEWPVLTAEQVHGDQIAIVAEPGQAGQLLQQKSATDRSDTNRGRWATQPIDPIGWPSGATRVDLPIESDAQFAGCDGIITNQREVVLGIHVADCCAVYIVDPEKPAIGLVHSGKKGTELGVVTNAIAQMKAHFGSNPADLVVQLSPCVRPPHYEVDFAAKIIGQCRAQGVKQIHDSGVCTACHPDLYYSYRAEKGKTGRMLALLALL